MSFAILLALTGLTLSAVAIYYSVIGLTAIFAAAFWPIVVMGATLEVAKLVAASWLKLYWERIPLGMKTYMAISVVVLMFITSMGIFGFLSKAHTDQTLISGDVQSQIALVDEKIKIERENIANAQAVIKQMDAAVNGVITTGDQEIKLRDGTTRIQSAAERSLQIRRSQARDRADLTKQIEQSQGRIVKLQEESAPIRAQVRKVEAEVGPIKYIAKLIYGDNPDQNLLEKAVVWVIMIIVFVFDPMAVLLILGAQMTWIWSKQEKERKDELVQEYTPPENTGEEAHPSPQPVGGTVDEGSGRDQQQDTTVAERDPADEANEKIAEIDREESENYSVYVVEVDEEPTAEESKDSEISAIEEWNRMIEAAEEEVEKESSEKIARHKWKENHPEDTIKRQERLKEVGLIETLPWEVAQDAGDPTYQIFPELQTEMRSIPEPDFPKDDGRIKPDLTEVIELDGSKKKNYIVKQDEHQIKKSRS